MKGFYLIALGLLAAIVASTWFAHEARMEHESKTITNKVWQGPLPDTLPMLVVTCIDGKCDTILKNFSIGGGAIIDTASPVICRGYVEISCTGTCCDSSHTIGDFNQYIDTLLLTPATKTEFK